LKNLKILNLSNNEIDNITEKFAGLTNLHELKLNNNEISVFPPIVIKNLINLNTLDLSENLLISLPKSIEYLINLQKLNLSQNKLSSLPAELKQLPQLHYLNCTKNPIDYKAQEIGNYQKNSSRAREAVKNYFNNLYDYYGTKINLEEVLLLLELENICNDPLPRVSAIKQTTYGYIEREGHIVGLGLFNKNITEIPDSFKNLKNLQYLSIDQNNLTELPVELFNSSHHHFELFFKENIFKKSIQQLVHYKKGKNIRIILLGPNKSGKSLFFEKLKQENPFEVYQDTLPIIDLKRKQIALENGNIFLFDLQGSKLNQKYYWPIGINQVDIVIFIFDGTIKSSTFNEEFDKTYRSFENMAQLVPSHKPVLILINKQDLIDFDPILEDEANKILPIQQLGDREIKIIPISAKYGEGVTLVFDWLITKLRI
jgi:Leucine-rich repeat (LRR) protein